MKNLVMIKCDTNDGDFVTETFYAKDDTIEFLKKVIKVFKKLKTQSWHKGWYGNDNEDPSILYKDYLTEDEIEDFDSMLPWGPDSVGIHSVESITVYLVEKETNLL